MSILTFPFLPFPTLPCPALLVIPFQLAGSMGYERCLDKQHPAYQQRAGISTFCCCGPGPVHAESHSQCTARVTS